MIDEKKIRARVEAATPGPWVACHEGECRCKSVDCDWGPVATVTCGDWGDSDELIYGTVGESVAAANARFIAHARQDIPDLLDMMETNEGDNDNLLNSAYAKIDHLNAEYSDMRAQRDAALNRIEFFEHAIESWKEEEIDWKGAEAALQKQLEYLKICIEGWADETQGSLYEDFDISARLAYGNFVDALQGCADRKGAMRLEHGEKSGVLLIKDIPGEEG